MKRDTMKRDAKSAKKLFNTKLDESKKLIELDDTELQQVAGGTYQCGGIGIPG